MTEQQIRVLIVDDSAMIRRVLRMLLERDPQIKVVGEAANGKQALARVEALHPTVITMDVRMPVMDGLETTERLMAYHPTPILVITASLSRYDIDITFRMLGAGALDVIEKPRLDSEGALSAVGQDLIRRVKAIARMKVVTHLRGRRRLERRDAMGEAWPEPSLRTDIASTGQSVPPVVTTALAPRMSELLVPPLVRASAGAPVPVVEESSGKAAREVPFPLVVIGASAGGPRVVHQILASLPRQFHAAVVVVQHIAEGFGAGMTEWLASAGSLRVRLAQDGAALEMGAVLVAPDSMDLVIRDDYRVGLLAAPASQQRARPSVDVAMSSAARVFGSSAVGVLLTGMGDDGAAGMLQIRQARGWTYAQDETTAPIYGMPRAAVEIGAVDMVLPPEEIVVALEQRTALIWLHIAGSRV